MTKSLAALVEAVKFNKGEAARSPSPLFSDPQPRETPSPNLPLPPGAGDSAIHWGFRGACSQTTAARVALAQPAGPVACGPRGEYSLSRIRAWPLVA
jgi:hypothetical protein